MGGFNGLLFKGPTPAHRYTHELHSKRDKNEVEAAAGSTRTPDYPQCSSCWQIWGNWREPASVSCDFMVINIVGDYSNDVLEPFGGAGFPVDGSISPSVFFRKLKVPEEGPETPLPRNPPPTSRRWLSRDNNNVSLTSAANG